MPSKITAPPSVAPRPWEDYVTVTPQRVALLRERLQKVLPKKESWETTHFLTIGDFLKTLNTHAATILAPSAIETGDTPPVLHRLTQEQWGELQAACQGFFRFKTSKSLTPAGAQEAEALLQSAGGARWGGAQELLLSAITDTWPAREASPFVTAQPLSLMETRASARAQHVLLPACAVSGAVAKMWKAWWKDAGKSGGLTEAITETQKILRLYPALQQEHAEAVLSPLTKLASLSEWLKTSPPETIRNFELLLCLGRRKLTRSQKKLRDTLRVEAPEYVEKSINTFLESVVTGVTKPQFYGPQKTEGQPFLYAMLKAPSPEQSRGRERDQSRLLDACDRISDNTDTSQDWVIRSRHYLWAMLLAWDGPSSEAHWKSLLLTARKHEAQTQRWKEAQATQSPPKTTPQFRHAVSTNKGTAACPPSIRSLLTHVECPEYIALALLEELPLVDTRKAIAQNTPLLTRSAAVRQALVARGQDQSIWRHVYSATPDAAEAAQLLEFIAQRGNLSAVRYLMRDDLRSGRWAKTPLRLSTGLLKMLLSDDSSAREDRVAAVRQLGSGNVVQKAMDPLPERASRKRSKR